ncbi:MAG: triosephosphate isomerase [Herpetosiphonaceae bacterium]|nr:MAG: triosephosphate isomerase [Herpetosiphonaceae bacterium]
MRLPLIAGNWKMYKTVEEARSLAQAVADDLRFDDREVLICPPFTALQAVRAVVEGTPLALGAQNMHWAEQGAYTGEISPLMLRDLGCSYVILGHSERRQYFGEDDALINRKVRSALEHGLRPILCVGETKAQRDAGNAKTVVLGQVRLCLEQVTAEQMHSLVIAYEPVWAIGTGDTATPADAQEMHEAIRNTLADLYGSQVADQVRIQYGGSVKPDNIDDLMAQSDIDGALVGGASLKAGDFRRIVAFERRS